MRDSLGSSRGINRHRYSIEEAEQELERPVVQALLQLCRFRNSHPAFNGEVRSPPASDGSIFFPLLYQDAAGDMCCQKGSTIVAAWQTWQNAPRSPICLRRGVARSDIIRLKESMLPIYTKPACCRASLEEVSVDADSPCNSHMPMQSAEEIWQQN